VARSVKLVPVAEGLRQPVWMTWAPDDTAARLFVVEKGGTIRGLRRGSDGKLAVDAAALVDIGPRLSSGQEQGLLGLAFHPHFAANKKLYIHYTDKHDNIHVAEFRLGPDGKSVDYESERDVLYLKHPFNNHNGGQLIFGPDNKLYIGTGDGGWGNDPFANGQDKKSRLGKMLRLDVDADKPAPETIMVGLRNPWRYDFDRKTGDLYIADVGQDRYEEVDVVAAAQIGQGGGQNFGWNVMEGLHCRNGDSCDRRGLILPVVEYNHKAGCSITGGFVYRGRALPLLDGVYFYADYCTALIRSFRWHAGNMSDQWEWRPVLDPGMHLSGIASFAEDAAGELYIVSLEGTIYELVPTNPKN
jgi:glucose/arabinose dehydrogenase